MAGVPSRLRQGLQSTTPLLSEHWQEGLTLQRLKVSERKLRNVRAVVSSGELRTVVGIVQLLQRGFCFHLVGAREPLEQGNS